MTLSGCGEQLASKAKVEEFSTSKSSSNTTKNEVNTTQNASSDSSTSDITITLKNKTDVIDDNTSDVEDNTTVDSNESESNSTIPDIPSLDDLNSTTDENTSVDVNGTETNSTGGVVITNPLLDPTDAVVDLKACKVDFGMATPLSDHHFNHEGLVRDDINGVSILSLYPEVSREDSLVTVIYNKISDPEQVDSSSQKINSYGDNSQFILSFDKVWLNEDNATFYVKTPKKSSGLEACFRLILNVNETTALENLDLTFTKVYR